MLRIHYLPGNHWVTNLEAAAVRRVAQQSVDEAREHLPLPEELYLLVFQSPHVPETGDGGFTLGPQVIRWDVDPARGIAELAEARLRNLLLHEAHHAARLTSRPSDHDFSTWVNAALFEGLATVFQFQITGQKMVWHEYDPARMEGWLSELIQLPPSAAQDDWRFQHPDGREHVIYKVGCWLVDRAISASGLSAAELVGKSETELLALAGIADRL